MGSIDEIIGDFINIIILYDKIKLTLLTSVKYHFSFYGNTLLFVVLFLTCEKRYDEVSKLFWLKKKHTRCLYIFEMTISKKIYGDYKLINSLLFVKSF